MSENVLEADFGRDHNELTTERAAEICNDAILEVLVAQEKIDEIMESAKAECAPFRDQMKEIK